MGWKSFEYDGRKISKNLLLKIENLVKNDTNLKNEKYNWFIQIKEKSFDLINEASFWLNNNLDTLKINKERLLILHKKFLVDRNLEKCKSSSS